MLETRRWWNESRSDFDVVVFEPVVQEVAQGDPTAAAERLAAIDGIRPVSILDAAKPLAAALVARHGLPEKARVDALHLAICATNHVPYLLTWNCRHLANATRQRTIAEIFQQAGYHAPVICTPTQLTPETKDG